MDTALRLMTMSEILVGIALVARFFLPSGTHVTFTLLSARASIAIPIQWFVPLLLITLGGMCSATALIKLVWSMTHAVVSA
jgi:hypothetical protein